MPDWIQSEPLTDDHLAEYHETGMVIFDGYMKQPYIDRMWAAITEAMPTWDKVKDPDAELGGDRRSLLRPFPWQQPELNLALTDPELIGFARKALGTEDIVYNGSNLVGRYPGAKVGSKQGWHIDNGNNSLLPRGEDQRFGQVVFWLWPDGIRKGDGELMLLAREHGEDFSKAVPVTGKGGTLAIFNNYTWHTGSDFANPDGQRLSWASIYGRADHPWEGLLPYTQKGRNNDFAKLIGSVSAKDRELFRFPPAGHAYYTPETLERLEAQYPGFNARGEY